MAELGAVTARFTRLVADDLDEEELARRVCEACVECPDVGGAAISVLTAEAPGGRCGPLKRRCGPRKRSP